MRAAHGDRAAGRAAAGAGRGRLLALAVVGMLLTGCSGGGGSLADAGGGSQEPFQLQLGGAVDELTEGGGATDVAFDVSGTGTLTEDIVLELADVPAGISAALSRTALRGGSVTLSIATDVGLASGTYRVVVRGRYGESTIDLPVDVVVVPVPFDFAVRAERRAVVLERDGQARIDVSTEVLRGTVPSRAWTLEDLPAGVTGEIVGGEVVLDADGSAVVGTHEIALAATAAPLTRRLSMLVHVVPQPTGTDVQVRAPTVLQVRRFGSTAGQVDVVRGTGVTGSVSLAVSGAPAGVGATFTDNPATQAVSNLLITADPTAPLGEHVLTITGTSGAESGTATVLLEVVDPADVPDARIQRVEFAQVFFSPDRTLVGDKDTVVRAHVVADEAGTAAPVVRVEGFMGGSSLGTRTLTGPSVLPTSEVPEDLDSSFRTTLPAAWVQDGLEVVVTLDPDDLVVDRDERNDRVLVAPSIGPSMAIDVVIVPLIVNGRTPSIASDYSGALRACWPLSDVQVSQRASYVVTSTTDVSSNGDGWSSVLSELASLRVADGSSAWYYGVVDTTYGSGVAGLGYIGFPVSIGWDRGSSAISVMQHEFGHTFGIRHAPCGGPSGVDSSYPYAGARLGHWGYDARNGQLIAPTSARDLMSYCGPEWISSYNHERARGNLAPFVFSALGVAGSSAGGSGEPAAYALEVPLMTVEATRDGAGAPRLGRVLRHRGHEPEPGGGAQGEGEGVRVRVLRAGGGVFEIAAAGHDVGCGADGTTHYTATFADPGDIVQVELLDRGQLVDAKSSAQAGGVLFAQAPTAPPTCTETFDSMGNPSLRLQWDSARWPEATVVHVVLDRDGRSRRTALALVASGGDALLPVAGLPSGGAFEVVLTKGLDAVRFEIPR
jgi:hypothetical protein